MAQQDHQSETKSAVSHHLEDVITTQSEIKDAQALRGLQIDAAAEKRLLWKIDLYLMPALWVLMIMSYIVLVPRRITDAH